MTLRPPSLVLAIVLACSLAASCSEQPSPSARPRSEVPLKSYTVPGVIEALPVEGRPGTQLIVRHEELPDFVRQDGTLGMKAMAMPFPLGPGLRLDGLAIGDAVIVDFTVDWNASPSYWVTAIRKKP